MSILLHACCGPCAMYPVDYLLNEGRINEQLNDINIYLKNKDSLINQFNDKKKLDFALLIIL